VGEKSASRPGRSLPSRKDAVPIVEEAEMFSKETEQFFKMKQDFSSKTEGRASCSDLMTNFTILSKETFLLINSHVWVAFAVCFEKLLEEKGPKEFKQASCIPRAVSLTWLT